MRAKETGFTVIEVVITLAITTMIIGTVYTFFFTSNKSLKTTDLNSTLQGEGQAIENELLFYGTQAGQLVSIDNKLSENILYSELNANGKLKVTNSIVFSVEGVNYSFEINGKELRIKKQNSTEQKILTTNLNSFEVRPIDLKLERKTKLSEAIGLEIVLILQKKEGYSDVSVPASTIVKFRNK